MDPRATTAQFYDLAPDFPPDVPFYLGQLGSSDLTVLELGCGTGRVMSPLAARVRFIQGIDLSPAMIARCTEQLRRAGLGPDRASASVGDITRLQLRVGFDLILAPFRVFQNLATDAQVAGFFDTVHAHLAPGGRCILNTFRPYADPEALITTWQTPAEDLDWERPVEGGVLRHLVRRAGVQADPLVLYPQLVYRRFRGPDLEEEVVSPIVMRCWYPAQLEARIQAAGFRVAGKWGGYQGEAYGSGPELVVAFTEA